jgi:SAM-dependent methyltransferase
MQHAVWREDAHTAWQRAGISAGSTVVDLGCGPGFAAVDLAALVGPSGRVIAIDKSERFLSHIAAETAKRNIANVEPRVCDLDADALPIERADAAWARWVFAFLSKPRELLARVANVIRPGGVFVAHEYLDYRVCRVSPRVPEIDEFITAVMASWRAQGGEPEIAVDLLRWLPELGFDVEATRVIGSVVAPGDPKWNWVAKFGETGLPRLVEIGALSADRAPAIAAAWRGLSTTPGVRMITPTVLEIVAKRR